MQLLCKKCHEYWICTCQFISCLRKYFVNIFQKKKCRIKYVTWFSREKAIVRICFYEKQLLGGKRPCKLILITLYCQMLPNGFFDICNAEMAQWCQKSWNLDIEGQFSMSKNVQIFPNFFSLKNINLGPHFL